MKEGLWEKKGERKRVNFSLAGIPQLSNTPLSVTVKFKFNFVPKFRTFKY